MNIPEGLLGYMDNKDRITQFPGKRQKNRQDLLLQWLVQHFERGKQYSEPQVNAILNLHHTFNDPALLRRLMFGKGLLNRTIDGRSYWVV